MTKNTPPAQRDKSWRTVVEMLVANFVVLAVSALVISRIVTFPCVTSPASTWSLAILAFSCFHLVCRLLYKSIEDHVVVGNALVPLRRKVTACFNDDELRTLCVDLCVDYESLGGTGKAGKVRALIAHLHPLGMIPKLIDCCAAERPNVDWESLVKPSTIQITATDAENMRDNPIISLFHKVHPRPEILPDIWLWVLAAASLVIAAILLLNPPWPFWPVEPTPFIESISVHPGSLALGVSETIEVLSGEQLEVRATLRGSARTLCTWSAGKGALLPAEGCATLYSAPPGETSDVLTVRVQSLCKTREAYRGLSVIVQPQ